MPTLTLGVGFENDEKIPVQKSHPYRVGGLFRHLGQVQGFQKLQFGHFGHPPQTSCKGATVQEVQCEFTRRRLFERVARCKKMFKTLHPEQSLKTLGGRVTCQRCLARSKRTKQQCKAPAIKGKLVCKTHGGRSTGPKTEGGRQRCAEAKTIHGRETREARSERSLASARLAVLEAVGFSIGLMSGTRTRGAKPNRMAEAFPELQALEGLG
jgi:hypothetical protein